MDGDETSPIEQNRILLSTIQGIGYDLNSCLTRNLIPNLSKQERRALTWLVEDESIINTNNHQGTV